jgi:hypothetical protein
MSSSSYDRISFTFGETQALHDFSLDIEEIEGWIADKLAVAADKFVKGIQNLQFRKFFYFEFIHQFSGANNEG